MPRWRYDGALIGLAGTPPRAVPSDLLAALCTAVLPGSPAQKLVLLAIFVLACTGMVRLLRDLPVAARAAAAVFFCWNPFVAERLLLGQWALLLGYAGLPWALDAVRTGRRRTVVTALLPAAAGGFMAMIITLPVLLAGGRRRPFAVGAWIALSLPWALPSLLRGVPGDVTGAEVFAARADTSFGVLGSLLCLSGVWNAEVVPDAYDLAVFAAPRLAVAVVLTWFGVKACRPLGVVAGICFAVASCEWLLPGLLGSLIRFWPGFAVLRDAQQFVAPLALTQAVGLAEVARRLRRDWAPVAVALPVLLLPGLLLGGFGRLTSVRYPAAFEAARRIIAADRTPGDVLLLPWAAYRSYEWNGGRGSLDPLVRYLPRRVVYNDAVRVGTTTVAAEDPRAARLTPLVESAAPLTGPLRAAGFRYVVIDADTRGFADRFPGLVPVLDGPALTLYLLEEG